MPAPSASGFDLLCRNTTIATADRQQTNATTITALVVAPMPKFIVGPQPVGTSRVFPQPARDTHEAEGCFCVRDGGTRFGSEQLLKNQPDKVDRGRMAYSSWIELGTMGKSFRAW